MEMRRDNLFRQSKSALKSKFSLGLLCGFTVNHTTGINFSSIWQSNTTCRYLLYPAIFPTCSLDAQSMHQLKERPSALTSPRTRTRTRPVVRRKSNSKLSPPCTVPSRKMAVKRCVLQNASSNGDRASTQPGLLFRLA